MDLIPTKHRSIVSPAAAGERRKNFDDYWAYTQGKDGQILEGQKDLTRKKERLEEFRQHPVRSSRHEWIGISAAWDATPTMANYSTIPPEILRESWVPSYCLT